MAKRKKGRKKRQRQGWFKRWHMLATGVLLLATIVPLFSIYVALAVLLAPTFVAFFVDRNPRRYLGQSVLFVNMCGALPAVLKIIELGRGLDALGAALADVYFWLGAYGSAAIGWLLFAFVPRAIGRFVAIKAQRRIRHLRDKQQQLVEEWGEDVTVEVRSYLESQDGQEALEGPSETDEALPPPPPDQGDIGDLPEFDMNELESRKEAAGA